MIVGVSILDIKLKNLKGRVLKIQNKVTQKKQKKKINKNTFVALTFSLSIWWLFGWFNNNGSIDICIDYRRHCCY